jgi:small subunit ribosomal protein S20
VANIKSQVKRIRTNEKAEARNKSARSAIKTAVRRFRDAVAAGDQKAINTELVAANKKLDEAVSSGVLHRNNAANKKSSLAKAANKASKSK